MYIILFINPWMNNQNKYDEFNFIEFYVWFMLDKTFQICYVSCDRIVDKFPKTQFHGVFE